MHHVGFLKKTTIVLVAFGFMAIFATPAFSDAVGQGTTAQVTRVFPRDGTFIFFTLTDMSHAASHGCTTEYYALHFQGQSRNYPKRWFRQTFDGLMQALHSGKQVRASFYDANGCTEEGAVGVQYIEFLDQ